MEQAKYGLLLFVFLALPPVANLMESIMIIHMHMQMPLIIVAGALMAPFFQKKFRVFFDKWNNQGIPGIILFLIVFSYWMIPRTMDEALTDPMMEIFKFISLAFLAGVPLRDSWSKLTNVGKNSIFIIFVIIFTLMGLLYVISPSQLCNNYLQSEQVTLGWGFIITAACILIYLVQMLFVNPEDYE